MKEKYDALIIRCPALGCEVPFLYCRQVNTGSPCNRLPGCWIERIEIFDYIEEFYSKEEIEKYFIFSGNKRLDKILKELERVKDMKDEENKRKDLIETLKKESPDGRITCAKAWDLADKFNLTRPKMGELLNELNIKIIKCQLGCF